jgi:hypothetical protein
LSSKRFADRGCICLFDVSYVKSATSVAIDPLNAFFAIGAA